MLNDNSTAKRVHLYASFKGRKIFTVGANTVEYHSTNIGSRLQTVR